MFPINICLDEKNDHGHNKKYFFNTKRHRTKIFNPIYIWCEHVYMCGSFRRSAISSVSRWSIFDIFIKDNNNDKKTISCRHSQHKNRTDLGEKNSDHFFNRSFSLHMSTANPTDKRTHFLKKNIMVEIFADG